jgi:penicillin-binding protein 1A
MVLGSLVAIAMLSAGIWVLSIAAETPDINELSPIDGGATSRIHAADGSRLGFIQSDEARTPIPLARMPEDLQNATIAIEDARFYEHDGVDLSSIARAAVENLKAGQTVQGGSTLTMQLVRNLYIVDPSRDLERKIREADLAEELENERSKEWILEQYLNTSSYGTVDGRTAIGVQAAADTYFAKPARELNLAESALIAGLTQAPSQYNPLQSPSAALARRNDVLEAMAAQGYISEERAREAAAAGIHLERGDRYTSIREPFFFDYVEQLLIESYGVNTVRRGGLDVYTTIDPKLQQAGRAAIEGQLDLPDDPSAAMVTIDPSNGHVLAMASSASYETEQYNLASQGRRQPGSAFKTFVLTAAVRRGIDPDTTTYASRELDLETPYGPWEVSTYSNSYSGAITLTQATLASDNTVYAQLDLDVGPEAVRDTAYDMGITTELDALPAEGIGGLRLGVSPLEMANAYATLASGGIRNTPVAIERVEFPDGEVDTPQEDKRERAFSDGVAFEVTRILEQNVRGGTGTAANIGCPAAGKTGTTDEFNDAWFAGFTPELSTAVWVGYPDALRSMASVHGITVAGGTFPARIWGEYMNVAKRSSCKGFPEAPQNPVAFEPFFGSYAQEGLELLRQEQEEEEEDLKEEAKAEKKAEKKAEEKAEEKAEKGSAGAGADPGYDADAYAPGIQPPSRRQLERAHSGG